MSKAAVDSLLRSDGWKLVSECVASQLRAQASEMVSLPTDKTVAEKFNKLRGAQELWNGVVLMLDRQLVPAEQSNKFEFSELALD